jgi:hypothetical protein
MYANVTLNVRIAWLMVIKKGCSFFYQESLTKLSSSFTLKLISAFNALNTRIMVSIAALLALLSSFEI